MQVHRAEVDADADVLRLNRVHDRVAVGAQRLGAHDDRIEVIGVRDARLAPPGIASSGMSRSPASRRAFSATRRAWNASIFVELRPHQRRLQVEHVVLVAGRR